jgi:hypothetical protein
MDFETVDSVLVHAPISSPESLTPKSPLDMPDASLSGHDSCHSTGPLFRDILSIRPTHPLPATFLSFPLPGPVFRTRCRRVQLDGMGEQYHFWCLRTDADPFKEGSNPEQDRPGVISMDQLPRRYGGNATD